MDTRSVSLLGIVADVSVVDVVVLAVAVAGAIGGWRRGAVVGVASIGGLACGFWLGGLAVSPVLGWLSTTAPSMAEHRILVSGVVLFGSALVLQSAAFGAAAALRRRLVGRGVRGIDSLAGAAVGVATVGLVVWLAAGFVRTTPLPDAHEAVAQSKVVGGLDRVAPVPSSRALGSAADALERAGFPRVFHGRPEQVESVDAPDGQIPPAVRDASDSVVRIIASSDRCGYGSQGSGWVASGDRVVTNAHVVAGAERIAVRPHDGGSQVQAQLIAFDPDSDVAVLQVDGLDAEPLPIAEPLERGDPAFAAGYPGNGSFEHSPARVRQVTVALGLDIHGFGPAERQIYSLRTIVESGDSGGPLLDRAGRVAGMVFARSTTDPQTGYALTMAEVRPVLQASAASGSVASGPCLAPGPGQQPS